MGEVHRLVHSEPVFRSAGGRSPDDQGFCAMGAGSRLAGRKRRGGPPARRAARTGSPAPSCGCRFQRKICCDGEVVCSQALMALADTAMVIACSAAWNGYRPMSTIDQTTHFLRPVNFDVIADARVVRIGRNTSFGRVMLLRRRRQAAGRHGGERLFDAVKSSPDFRGAEAITPSAQRTFNFRREPLSSRPSVTQREGLAMRAEFARCRCSSR